MNLRERKKISKVEKTLDEKPAIENVTTLKETDVPDHPEIIDNDCTLSVDDNDDADGSLRDLSDITTADPFAKHFEQEITEELASKLLSSVTKDQKGNVLWSSEEVTLCHLGKAENFNSIAYFESLPDLNEGDLIKLHVKKSLVDQLPTANIWNMNQGHLSELQLELFAIINSYKDLYFPHRTHKNGEEIRVVYCLHALNHVLKTRNRVVRHNRKIEAMKDYVDDSFRDQGLTRPKVLIVLPFRDSALKVVQMMMKLLSDREYTVTSKKRFESEYGSEIDLKKGLKPDDFEATFDGNIDDKFRIGVSISKKALKLYEDFYSSDIIIASPLGLSEIIGAENEKEKDFEFLSSIEVLIFDQMDVLLMQNFDYVMLILNQLHHMPKETHGVDYFRVRMWALNGWSKLYRQTVMLGCVTHPMIETIFRRHCFNYSGRLKVLNHPSSGTIENVHHANALVQIFQRVNTSSVQDGPDARFEFFIKKILPHYVNRIVSGQTLIFFSSYFDFIRLRNYFAIEEKNGSGANFAVLSEYMKKGGISASRQHFLEKTVRFLLVTERFHFYRRYKIRGIQHLIFYDLPIYSHFYPELCNMIQDSSGEAIEKFNQGCTVLFSKYDADRLVPVVGYEKACELIASDKNVHTFHSQ